MKKFLQQIAEAYLREEGAGIGECCFVFPNRRSALFFSKYLGQASDRPVFSPTLLTISDLFAELSNLRPIDKIGALYLLYKRYAALMWPSEEPKESFDQFVFWGDILLGDFDDIDKYMVDARLLFSNIHDLNQIDSGYQYLSDEQVAAIREFWGNFLKREGSPERGSLNKKELFGNTWSILYDLYCNFKADLEAQERGYEGMIYRSVAETLRGEGPDKDAMVQRLGDYRRIVFVGLNALNECEKTLLNVVKTRLDGDFYWDAEDPRTTDPANKASKFILDNRRNYPGKIALKPSLPQSQKFRTIAVSSSVAQTRVAGDILRRLALESGFDPIDTAVVLPDENLLIPMLNSVPEEIGEVNVTMGLPLASGNAATFVSFLDRLHRNSKIKNEEVSFYHRDVENLLCHPFLSSGETAALMAEVRKKNMIYVPQSIFAGSAEALRATFKAVADSDALPDYILEILDNISDGISPIDREFVCQLHKSVERMRGLEIPMQKKTWFSLLGQLISVISIPFKGEPLAGLQVMGPLETRALDFKNIIMLSVSEGVFPKASVSGSFIPYNLRVGFNLPTYEFQDSLSSYYFYRSISRAENIVLLYDSRTGGIQSGEASRFIKQLKYHFRVDLNECSANIPLQVEHKEDEESVTIEKTQEIVARMRSLFLEKNPETGYRKPFSASSINTYLECPVKFYYSQVERIREDDEVVEELDYSLFGSVFHKVMENIYKPLIGKELSREDIESVSRNEKLIDSLIDDAFLTEARIREISGKNLIIRRLIRQFVMEILSNDSLRAPLTIRGTERKVHLDMKLPSGDTVSLYGVIDRQDHIGDRDIIIDYKTGKVEGKVEFKEISDIFDRESESRPSIAQQLFFYAMLDGKENPCLAVYGLREVFSKGFSYETAFTSDDIDQYKNYLADLISEILDPDIPFKAFKPKCENCDFKTLCGK